MVLSRVKVEVLRFSRYPICYFEERIPRQGDLSRIARHSITQKSELTLINPSRVILSLPKIEFTSKTLVPNGKRSSSEAATWHATPRRHCLRHTSRSCE